MARFRVEKPQENVRLRKWAPGRLSQLKLFLSHLEEAFNSNSLAAQVLQSPKRKFSRFIPKIPSQDITGEVEYREIRVTIQEPKGLKNFLFYEYQISQSDIFSTFEAFFSPDTHFVFPDLQDDARFYIRVRVISKDGDVGPFSDVFTARTPVAKAQATVDASATAVVVSGTTFSTIFTRSVTLSGGDTYIAIDYEVFPNDVTGDINWCDTEFRWLVDDNQLGQNMPVTSYGGGTPFKAVTDEIGSFPGDILETPGDFLIVRRGSFLQKFTTLDAGAHTIELQARNLGPDIHPTPDDYTFAVGATPDYDTDAAVTLRNFHIFVVNIA